MTIDLQQFCSTEDDLREFTLKPFSWKGKTYATDGRIIVRVPELPDAPAMKDAPNERAELLFLGHEGRRFIPVPMVDVPAPATESNECHECRGIGREHPCPDCQCTCEECGGIGRVEVTKDCSVSLGETLVSGRYLRLIQKLPNAEIAPDDTMTQAPMPFRFDGGEGVLMPRISQAKVHIVIELPAKEPCA